MRLIKVEDLQPGMMLYAPGEYYHKSIIKEIYNDFNRDHVWYDIRVELTHLSGETFMDAIRAVKGKTFKIIDSSLVVME
jgi:hypothetical protein